MAEVIPAVVLIAVIFLMGIALGVMIAKITGGRRE
jgi:hypothetical protein